MAARSRLDVRWHAMLRGSLACALGPATENTVQRGTRPTKRCSAPCLSFALSVFISLAYSFPLLCPSVSGTHLRAPHRRHRVFAQMHMYTSSVLDARVEADGYACANVGEGVWSPGVAGDVERETPRCGDRGAPTPTPEPSSMRLACAKVGRSGGAQGELCVMVPL